MKIGYCCINVSLRQKKPSVFTNRTINRKNFSIEKAATLALQNVKDLLTILKWNETNKIRVFRITSDLFPRLTDPYCSYTIDDLSTSKEIKNELANIGQFAKKHMHLLSFHPGPFTVLGSPNIKYRESSLKEIETHSLICDLISAQAKTLDIPINIHVGGSYNETFNETATRFIQCFNKLSKNAKKRLVIENDDKRSGWSVRRLYNLLYKKIHIPITIDLHHWLFCHDRFTMKEDFYLAKKTWGKRSNQVHYSESATKKLMPAHSKYIKNKLPNFIIRTPRCHIHFEAKAKEKAVLKYINP